MTPMAALAGIEARAKGLESSLITAFALLIAIGFVLATVVYLVFSKLLSLTLPSGPLEHLF